MRSSLGLGGTSRTATTPKRKRNDDNRNRGPAGTALRQNNSENRDSRNSPNFAVALNCCVHETIYVTSVAATHSSIRHAPLRPRCFSSFRKTNKSICKERIWGIRVSLSTPMANPAPEISPSHRFEARIDIRLRRGARELNLQGWAHDLK
jgi:hypothetical protein